MLKNLKNSFKSWKFLQIFSLLIISYKSHNSYKFFKSSNLSPTGMKFRSSLAGACCTKKRGKLRAYHHSTIYHHISQPITTYHEKPKLTWPYTMAYNHLSSSTTVYLPPSTIAYRNLPPSIKAYHNLPQHITTYHRLSQHITTYHNISTPTITSPSNLPFLPYRSLLQC